MALNVKCGTFALNTSTGNQSITGVGFEPKIVFFLNAPDTADITTDVANYHQMFGAAASSSQEFVMYANSINGQTTSDSMNILLTNACIVAYDPPGGSGAVDYQADFVSMDSGGFTINISNAPGVGYIVGYLALGGSDIENVKVSNFTWGVPTGVTTVSGVGFIPDALIVAGGDGAAGSVTAHMRFAIGFATDTNQGEIYVVDDDNAGTSNSARNSLDTRISNQNIGAGAQNSTFGQFKNDGWDYTVNTSPPTGRPAGYVAIKCTSVALGTTTLPTSTGSHAVTGIGFQPRAGLFFSPCSPLTASTNDAQWSFGMAQSNLARFCTGGISDDNVADTVTSHLSTSQGIYRATTPLPGSVEEAADFSSWDANGFTLDVETAVGTNPAVIHYMVFGGDAPPSDPGGSGGDGGAGTFSGFGDEF